MGKKAMEEVFDIPEEKINSIVSDMVKQPAVEKPKEAVPKETKKKNNVSEEGRAKMLANLKKGRESRKINLNKEHELRQNELKTELAELKTLVKETMSKKEEPKAEPIKEIKAQEPEPIKPKEEPRQEMKQVSIPILKPKAAMPVFIKSNYKKPAYW